MALWDNVPKKFSETLNEAINTMLKKKTQMLIEKNQEFIQVMNGPDAEPLEPKETLTEEDDFPIYRQTEAGIEEITNEA